LRGLSLTIVDDGEHLVQCLQLVRSEAAEDLPQGLVARGLTGRERVSAFVRLLEKALQGLRIGDPRRGDTIITRLATDPAFAGHTGGYFSVKDADPCRVPNPAVVKPFNGGCGKLPRSCSPDEAIEV
jgi:hypothetical protein